MQISRNVFFLWPKWKTVSLHNAQHIFCFLKGVIELANRLLGGIEIYTTTKYDRLSLRVPQRFPVRWPHISKIVGQDEITCTKGNKKHTGARTTFTPTRFKIYQSIPASDLPIRLHLSRNKKCVEHYED